MSNDGQGIRTFRETGLSTVEIVAGWDFFINRLFISITGNTT